MPLPSWGQSSYRVLNDVLCGLKFSEGDLVLRMAGCVRDRRNGCCFNLVFGIMVSKVTVKQDCGSGGREAEVITGERFPGRRNAVQRPCGRCGGEMAGRLEDRGVSLRGKGGREKARGKKRTVALEDFISTKSPGPRKASWSWIICVLSALHVGLTHDQRAPFPGRAWWDSRD